MSLSRRFVCGTDGSQSSASTVQWPGSSLQALDQKTSCPGMGHCLARHPVYMTTHAFQSDEQYWSVLSTNWFSKPILVYSDHNVRYHSKSFQHSWLVPLCTADCGVHRLPTQRLWENQNWHKSKTSFGESFLGAVKSSTVTVLRLSHGEND